MFIAAFTSLSILSCPYFQSSDDKQCGILTGKYIRISMSKALHPLPNAKPLRKGNSRCFFVKKIVVTGKIVLPVFYR